MKTVSIRFFLFLHCLCLIQVYGNEDKEAEGTEASPTTVAPEDIDKPDVQQNDIAARSVISWMKGRQDAPNTPGTAGLLPLLLLSLLSQAALQSGAPNFNQPTGIGQPMGQLGIGQPLGQMGFGQPLGQTGFPQPYGQSDFNQPLNQPDLGQPMGQTGFGQPDLGQPLGQPAFGQSLGQPDFSQSLEQPDFSQSLGQPDFSQPLGQLDFNQPLGQPDFNQPLGQTGFGQPLGQTGFGQPLGQTGYDSTLGQPSGLGSPQSVPTVEMEEGPSGALTIVGGTYPLAKSDIILQDNNQLVPEGDSQDVVIDHLIRSRVADIQRFVLELNKFTQLLTSVALSFVSTTNMFGEVERKPFFDPENLRNVKILVDLFRNLKDQAGTLMANLLNDFTFTLNYLSSQPLFGISTLARQLTTGLYRRLSNLPATLLREFVQRRLLNRH